MKINSQSSFGNSEITQQRPSFGFSAIPGKAGYMVEQIMMAKKPVANTAHHDKPKYCRAEAQQIGRR